MRTKTSAASRAAPAFVYLSNLGAQGDEVVLSASESHYVARVCRARAGECVEGTDGRGRVATLRLASVDREVRARVEQVAQRQRTRGAWLLCGSPEGQRDDWMVEKLAELGVERFSPIDCERGPWQSSERRRERWERLAIAALRQSHSAFRMEIGDPVPLPDAIAVLPDAILRWLARPDGARPIPPEGAGGLAAVVGPAAGLTARENDSLVERGFAAVSLGSGQLRAETAAVSLASIWAAGG